MTFLHSTLQLFKKPLLLPQKTNALFPELAEIIDLFWSKILQRQSSEFFGASTADLLKTFDEENANALKSSFQEFYTITMEHFSKWGRLEKHPKHISWTLLRVLAIEYEEAKELAKHFDPSLAIKGELFDEVLTFNSLLNKIPDDEFYKNKAETRWMKIFNENDSFPLLYKFFVCLCTPPLPRDGGTA